MSFQTPLPLFQKVSDPDELVELFILKCQSAEKMFTFNKKDSEKVPSMEEVSGKNSSQSASGNKVRHKSKEDLLKYEKENSLKDIIDFLKTKEGSQMIYVPECYEAIVKVFSEHVFRCPQLVQDKDAEVNPLLDRQWPHLVLVYCAFQKFVENDNFNPNIASTQINVNFTKKLFPVFASDDPRERYALTLLAHKIYSKFMGLRIDMRNQINNCLMEFVHESQQHSGITELLELYGSIINGFTLPLREDHITSLKRTLLPLLKVDNYDLTLFFPELSYCILQFLEKEPTLYEEITFRVIQYWPHMCSSKQMMFIDLLEEIIDVADPADFEKICQPVVTKIAICIANAQWQVSQRALNFWSNEYSLTLLEAYSDIIFPIILPSMIRVCENHWYSDMRWLAIETLKTLSVMDLELVEEILALKKKTYLLRWKMEDAHRQRTPKVLKSD